MIHLYQTNNQRDPEVLSIYNACYHNEQQNRSWDLLYTSDWYTTKFLDRHFL